MNQKKIKVFNTMSRKKEELKPIQDMQIKMYVCGPTVYDDIHIGNARSAVNFDTIRKYLIYSGYSVKYVMNITDIDDKIIKKAIDEKKEFSEIASKYTRNYLDVMEKLNVMPPDVQPKATDSIDEMVELISGLIDKRYAYSSGGDVLYDTKEFQNYGRLSGKHLEELIEGIRVEKNDTKKNPTDFVLWKAAKPGEPEWDSPWGKGRPGWHIECSAMVRKHLGDSIDIHGGGVDLIFPHHENEIAQCEAFTKKHYVNYWLHNGFIEIDGQKMSKSLGNIWKTADALVPFKAEVLRYFFLSAQYRSSLNYDEKTLEMAKAGLGTFTDTISKLDSGLKNKCGVKTVFIDELLMVVTNFEKNFSEAMDDDFNTPEALGELFNLARITRNVMAQEHFSEVEKKALAKAQELMCQFGWLLGIVIKDKFNFWEIFESIDKKINNTQSEIDENLVDFLEHEKNRKRVATALNDRNNSNQYLNVALYFDFLKTTRSLLEPGYVTVDLLHKTKKELELFSDFCGIKRERNLGLFQQAELLAFNRSLLKKEKKFKEADEVREQIMSLGFTVEDVRGGEYKVFPMPGYAKYEFVRNLLPDNLIRKFAIQKKSEIIQIVNGYQLLEFQHGTARLCQEVLNHQVKFDDLDFYVDDVVRDFFGQHPAKSFFENINFD
jgi:cysteinyl-tRNA synthetase